MAENFKRNASVRMFILAGGMEYKGFEQQVERMEKILRENGSANNELIVKIVADGTHSEQFWRSEFPSAFKWLFQLYNKNKNPGMPGIFSYFIRKSLFI